MSLSMFIILKLRAAAKKGGGVKVEPLRKKITFFEGRGKKIREKKCGHKVRPLPPLMKKIKGDMIVE